jgi:hypothetical protein
MNKYQHQYMLGFAGMPFDISSLLFDSLAGYGSRGGLAARVDCEDDAALNSLVRDDVGDRVAAALAAVDVDCVDCGE